MKEEKKERSKEKDSCVLGTPAKRKDLRRKDSDVWGTLA
jgi:hypothetical protein